MPIESHTEKRLLRALVAEDDPGVRRLIASLLEMDGWEVREASDGDEAVAMAEDWHPDAVVIDVMMPGTDGLAALRQLRDDEEDCAVVVVSGRADTEQDAMDAGADDFLAKPFDPEDLSARTRAALRWHGVGATPR